ncbi:MAG: tetratricopeptide repeat protein [Planctomycetota bacterium]|nr:tetratricopeptide repeat protein [Planctomycetota bacterium]
MPDERADSPEERLLQEAEELMRQRRYRDAARRYQDLYRRQPTDLWTSLGLASALECAGEVESAEQILDDAVLHHGSSPSLHRFRHLFFVRREDVARAHASQLALRQHASDAGEGDQLVDLYFNQGRYREALAEIERFLSEHPHADAEMRAGLLARSGACLRQMGEPERARDQLLMALALHPESSWTYAELAETERTLGMVEAAREHYQEALRLAPDDDWTRGHLAQLEYELGNQQRAHELYEEILARAPELPWALVEYAQTLLPAERARAAELCRRALAIDPDYPWAHTLLASIARQEERIDEALAAYQRALSAAPSANWILHEASETARHAGRWELAERLLERALANDPYDATTHGHFADLRRAQGRLEEALFHLERAVSLDDHYTWAWRELAEVRALLGKHHEAEAACKRARDLAPDDAASDGLVAFLLKQRGERERMLPWLERAIERQPDYFWAWRELIELHVAAQRLAEAEAAAQRALEQFPEHPLLLGLLAEILRRSERWDAAEAAIQRALAVAGDVPQLWALAADIALRRGEPQEAVQRAGRAAELGNSAEYTVLQAQILAATGAVAEARARLAPLLEKPEASAIAWELAGLLAEQLEDPATALVAYERSLALDDQPRVRIRRARLAVQRGDRAAALALLPLLDQPDADLPWGELAITLAQAGQALAARRAALRHAAQLPPAAACLHLAEVAWHLDDLPQAARLIRDAALLDPDNAMTRQLAALVAEAAGDLAEAAEHLAAAQRLRPDDLALVRQNALLAERRGDQEAAAALWREVAARSASDAGEAWEAAAALWRLGRHEEAAALTDKVLAGPPTAERCRLWYERGLAIARRDGPAAGLAALESRPELLRSAGHALAVQLALNADDLPAARRHVAELARAPEPDATLQQLLEARVRLASGAVAEAVEIARALIARSPADSPQGHDATMVLAEGLVVLGQLPEALAALQRRPTPWPAGWAALCAVIALAVHGPAAAALALTRCPDPLTHPLARLLAAALPGTLSGPEPSEREVPALPAALAGPLARALLHARQAALAEAVCRRAAAVAPAPLARELRRLARRCLRRRAGWWAAWRDAWQARDWREICTGALRP